jgi:hypothetical protein
MTFDITPSKIENDEVQLVGDGSGNLAIKHVPSGETITLDESVAISDFWNSSAGHVVQSALKNDTITRTGGTGLTYSSGSAATALGGSATLAIASGGVGTTELATDAVTSSEIADNTVSTSDLATDAVTSSEIADNTVSTSDLATDAVTSSEITDGTVSTSDLATDAVTSSEITDGTVTNADLNNSSVTLTSGDGLKNGGSVSLGSSTTLDVEPADFAGAGLADDGSDNLTPSTSDQGTITATGGSSPAADTVVSTSLSQTDAYDTLLYVDSDPAFDADYQFNWDYAHFWDDSGSALKIDFTVNWDTDPGNTNDVNLRWEVINR